MDPSGGSGMIAALAVVLTLELLSILVLALNVQIFRRKAVKYQRLFSGFGGAGFWWTPGRILLPTYVLLTFAATIITTSLFIWHLRLL